MMNSTDPAIPDERFVIIDTETTGLIPQIDLVLEVGAIIVDIDTWKITDKFSVCIFDGMRYAKKVGDLKHQKDIGGDSFVFDMHTKSGLWDDCHKDGVSIVEASIAMVKWLTYNGVNKLDPMTGSNVAFDRNMLKEHLPHVEDLFHYRNIDVSTIKELCRRVNPNLYRQLEKATPKREAHRVLSDCEDTMGELEFYMDNFLYW